MLDAAGGGVQIHPPVESTRNGQDGYLVHLEMADGSVLEFEFFSPETAALFEKGPDGEFLRRSRWSFLAKTLRPRFVVCTR